MTDIVAVTRLRADLGVSGVDGGLAVADLRHPDAVEDLLRTRSWPLVLTCLTDDAPEIRGILSLAKTRWPAFTGCVEPVARSPLALSVLSRLAADASGSAATFATIDAAHDACWTAVWTSRVTSWVDPAPSMSQHLASYLPNSRFLVEHGRPGRITRLSEPPAPEHNGFAGSTLFHTETSASWLPGAIGASLGIEDLAPFSSLRAAVDAYDDEAAVEFVALPPGLDDEVTRRVSEAVTCRGCGLEHARATCPICQMSVAETDVALEGAQS